MTSLTLLLVTLALKDRRHCVPTLSRLQLGWHFLFKSGQKVGGVFFYVSKRSLNYTQDTKPKTFNQEDSI